MEETDVKHSLEAALIATHEADIHLWSSKVEYLICELINRGLVIRPANEVFGPAPATPPVERHQWLPARCTTWKGWAVVSYKGWNQNKDEFYYCLRFVRDFTFDDNGVEDDMRAEKLLPIHFDTKTGE